LPNASPQPVPDVADVTGMAFHVRPALRAFHAIGSSVIFKPSTGPMAAPGVTVVNSDHQHQHQPSQAAQSEVAQSPVVQSEVVQSQPDGTPVAQSPVVQTEPQLAQTQSVENQVAESQPVQTQPKVQIFNHFHFFNAPRLLFQVSQP
jgi:hypothetical protein